MNLIPYELIRVIALLLVLICIPIFIIFYYRLPKKKRLNNVILEGTLLFILIIIAVFAGKVTTGHASLYYFGHAQGPFEYGPELPFWSSLKFFSHIKEFQTVEDISHHPAEIPPFSFNTEPQTILVDMEATEVLAEIGDGITYNYWTINQKVPGPFIRAKVGDSITINFKNSMSSLHTHSVDFHATTGPGGGAKVLQVPPGETKSLTWKALNPGLYVYHCASAHSVAAHMAHGQYGLILIEPTEGLPPVDKEFYVVQGELYTRGDIGDKGLVAFDSQAMLDENPNYVVFNGRLKALNGKMNAKVGDRIRIYVGNGGVSKISSFHVIGEIFDAVYPEGAIGSEVHRNVQSTLIPAGGSTIVEFTVDVPGDYVLVDHALSRMDKGAWGVLHVEGEENKEIFNPLSR